MAAGGAGSPPRAGGERYVSLLSEGAAEWNRLGVEVLVLELLLKYSEPLTCILFARF